MIIIIASISALLLILKINKQILSSQYKLLNPINVLCAIWIMVYICHYIFWGNNSNGNIYILTSIALSFLAIGFWIAFYRNINNIQSNKYHLAYNKGNLTKLLILFIIIDLLKLIYNTYVVVYILSDGNWIRFIYDNSEIRLQYLNRTSSIIETIVSFLGSLLGYIGYILLALYCSLKLRKRWRYFAIISTIELLLSIVTMSKFSFIVFLLTFIVAYLNQLPSLKSQKSIIKKIFPLASCVIFSFFLLIGLQRNYSETKGGLEEGVINGILTYFAGPFEAFSKVYNEDLDISQFEHGMIDIGNSAVNVFTWFFYFSSILKIGIILLPLVIGVISGWCYRPWKKNLFFDVVNTYLSVIFAMSFFDFLLKFTVFPVLFIITAYINRNYRKYLYQKQ